jgi:hypothetical protein
MTASTPMDRKSEARLIVTIGILGWGEAVEIDGTGMNWNHRIDFGV